MSEIDEKLYELGSIVKKQAEVVDELQGHLFGISYATYALIDTLANRSSADKEALRREMVARFESLEDQKSETARYLGVFIQHLSN